MRFFIPTIKQKITLAEDWTFDVYGEYRNKSLYKDILGLDNIGLSYYASDKIVSKYTFEKGQTLIVDRIYIKNGLQQFDSITFRTFVIFNGKKKTIRFWAKLSDVNKMEIEEPK
jgi:antitoxin component YwqK of YwqJK toxin-antitoxin module